MSNAYSFSSGQPEAAGKAATVSQRQLVSARQLLEILWAEESRPSLRWLRTQQRRRTLPFIKLGRRVFFNPEEVLRALQERHGIASRKP